MVLTMWLERAGEELAKSVATTALKAGTAVNTGRGMGLSVIDGADLQPSLWSTTTAKSGVAGTVLEAVLHLAPQ